MINTIEEKNISNDLGNDYEMMKKQEYLVRVSFNLPYIENVMEESYLIQEAFEQPNFLKVHYCLMDKLPKTDAYIMAHLVSLFVLFSQQNTLIKGSWLYIGKRTWEILETITQCNKKHLQKRLKILEEKGFFYSKIAGLPPRKCICLIPNKIADLYGCCPINKKSMGACRGVSMGACRGELTSASGRTYNRYTKNNRHTKDNRHKDFPFANANRKSVDTQGTFSNPSSFPKGERPKAVSDPKAKQPFRRRPKPTPPVSKDAGAARPDWNNGSGGTGEKPVRISPVISKLIAYWNTLDNVTRHKNKGTKVYMRCVDYLIRLMAGTFFDDKEGFEELAGRKFTQDEILWAMRSYSQSKLAEDKRRGLDAFIWNERSKVKRFKSLFFDMFMLPDDPNQVVTRAIKKEYVKQFRGLDGEFTKDDEVKFIKASSRLMRFIQTHKKDLVVSRPKPRTAARWLVDAIANEFQGNDVKKAIVTPGWLCSDKTFSNRLPNFLFAQAIIKE